MNPYYTISNLYVSTTPVINFEGPFYGEFVQRAPELMDVFVTIPPESINNTWTFGFNVHQDDTKKGLFVIFSYSQDLVNIYDAQTKSTITVSSNSVDLKQ